MLVDIETFFFCIKSIFIASLNDSNSNTGSPPTNTIFVPFVHSFLFAPFWSYLRQQRNKKRIYQEVKQ